jgi:hypothetical protein
MDYFVLPGSLEKAKAQFAQAKPMMEAFRKYFGEYPFTKDGYKLIEVPTRAPSPTATASPTATSSATGPAWA